MEGLIMCSITLDKRGNTVVVFFFFYTLNYKLKVNVLKSVLVTWHSGVEEGTRERGLVKE